MTSLRARLLALLVALVTLGFVAAGITTHQLLRSRLLDRIDEQYDSLAVPLVRDLTTPSFRSSTVEEVRGTLEDLLPPGGSVELRSEGRLLISASRRLAGADDPAPRPELPARPPSSARAGGSSPEPFATKATTGEEFRSYAISFDSGEVLIVSLSMAEVNDTLDQLVRIELVIMAVAAVAVVILGWWLVRIGLRPLRDVGRTADAIAGGDLTRRVELTDPRTEVGRLGLAFNEMLERIEVAFEDQRASEARLRQFVADASHELRTPLTSVRGYAELFRSGAATRPEDLAKAMSRIEDEAQRMGVLVDDLLLLARLDQGRPLERAAVDLAGIAAQAVERAAELDADHHYALEASGPAMVVGDADRLRQVLDNVLQNVRRHTHAGTAARVRVFRRGEQVVLEVADEGPGLTEEERAHVFERFYRADVSRTRDRGGSGLGLSIVAAIANAHGGSVELDAAPGRGVTFRMALPVFVPEAASITVPSSPPLGPPVA